MVSPNVALNLFSSSILELLCASNEKYYPAQTSCLQGASGELRGGVGQATRGCRTSHIRGIALPCSALCRFFRHRSWTCFARAIKSATPNRILPSKAFRGAPTGGSGKPQGGCRTSRACGQLRVLFGTLPAFSSSILQLDCASNKKC